MRRYHFFDLWGASTQISLCGRKLANAWTVRESARARRRGCKSCGRVARGRDTDPRKYSLIEDRA